MMANQTHEYSVLNVISMDVAQQIFFQKER